jgi:hypothetical protein
MFNDDHVREKEECDVLKKDNKFVASILFYTLK